MLCSISKLLNGYFVQEIAVPGYKHSKEGTSRGQKHHTLCLSLSTKASIHLSSGHQAVTRVGKMVFSVTSLDKEIKPPAKFKAPHET